jgi:hypothetical protein
MIAAKGCLTLVHVLSHLVRDRENADDLFLFHAF